MKTITIAITALILSASFITGCSGAVYSYDNFIDDLLDSDASVQIGEASDHQGRISPFLANTRYNIKVNGENVNIYEYDNEALADEDAAHVYPDGFRYDRIDETGIGRSTSWSWVGPPHFYKKGRIIVIYVDVSHGSDPTVRNLLESILGSQFAGSTSLAAIQLPELEELTEVLGYSLAPTNMPEGFKFDSYQLLAFTESMVSSKLIPYASIVYGGLKDSAYRNIFIHYPQRFPPLTGEDSLLELLGLDWQHPSNAVSEVEVNDETAYLVRGGWSADALEKLTLPDPVVLSTYTPEWDYDMYLSLYFDYKLPSGETVDVMIRAGLFSYEWITTTELVKIAESIAHTPLG